MARSLSLASLLRIITAALVLSLPCRAGRADVTVFDPGNAAHLAEDGSHFASEADPAHYADWKEWWYFNFHEPDLEDGWDGFIVFHTRGDLRAGGGSHEVQVAVFIWNGGEVRWVQSDPLLGQDLSGYNSSTSKCDVSIQVAGPNTCTAQYDAIADEYTISVSSTSGLSIALSYGRISAGFLPGLHGFPDSSWRNLFWVVPMPYAEVTGTITLPGEGARTIDGTGYHDHNWGHWDGADAVWDWGECPVPADDAAIIYGKVDGGDDGTVGVVVATDDTGLVAWAENEAMDVSYSSGWSGSPPANYPNVEHVYGKRAGTTIEIESGIDHHMAGGRVGFVTEIAAGYSGKIYRSNDHSDVILAASSDTSKGFLEYHDHDGEPDTTTPGAPTGLSATSISSTRIYLSWSAPSGSPAGYNVFRSRQDGGPYLYAGTARGTTSYQDQECQSGTTYYYVVTAYDSVPNEGGKSNQASATTQPFGVPALAPWGLVAMALCLLTTGAAARPTSPGGQRARHHRGYPPAPLKRVVESDTSCPPLAAPDRLCPPSRLAEIA